MRITLEPENISQVRWVHPMVRKRVFVDVSPSPSQQPHYVPALLPVPGTVKHSLRKLSIATIEVPESACGIALRVGYTGKLETDLAIYRLKVKTRPELPLVALDGFFVLKEGIFRAYTP